MLWKSSNDSVSTACTFSFTDLVSADNHDLCPILFFSVALPPRSFSWSLSVNVFPFPLAGLAFSLDEISVASLQLSRAESQWRNKIVVNIASALGRDDLLSVSPALWHKLRKTKHNKKEPSNCPFKPSCTRKCFVLFVFVFTTVDFILKTSFKCHSSQQKAVLFQTMNELPKLASKTLSSADTLPFRKCLLDGIRTFNRDFKSYICKFNNSSASFVSCLKMPTVKKEHAKLKKYRSYRSTR